MENNLLTFLSEVNGWDFGFQLGFEPHQRLSIFSSEPSELIGFFSIDICCQFFRSISHRQGRTNCLVFCLRVFGSSNSVPSPCFLARPAQASLLCCALYLSTGVKHTMNLKLFDPKIFQTMSWKVLSDPAFVCISTASTGPERSHTPLGFLASRPLCCMPTLSE